MSKRLNIGQDVWIIKEIMEDAVCKHCGSTYQVHSHYEPICYQIKNICKDYCGYLIYSLERKENGFIFGTSKFRDEIFTSESDAICEARVMDESEVVEAMK